MKKFSKMLALGLAAALVFGMAVQAESPNGDNSGADAGALKDAASVSNTVVVDGKEVAVEFETPTVLEETKVVEVKNEVAKADVQSNIEGKLKAAAVVASNKKVASAVVKAAFQLEPPKGLTDAQIKSGVRIPFTLDSDLKKNAAYCVLHYFSDGSYEVLPATKGEGRTIFATFTDFSPVVIVELELVGDETTSNPPDNNNNTQNQETSPATAPKTGETVPVAGVMALVLMAGAVFCAKKARYNR